MVAQFQTEAVVDAATTDAEALYDFSQQNVSIKDLVKKYSKNYHKGFLDMNIKINLHKARRAKMIQGLEERLNKEYLAYNFNLTRFKSKIRKPDGKLSWADIGKLNTVYK